MKYTTTLMPIALLALVLVPALASAETAVTTGANVSATAEAPTGVRANVTAGASASQSIVLMRGKDRAHQEIDRRITNLNALIERVKGMKNLSETDKTAISATLASQVTALGALKVKIDADTDADTLKEDVKSITGSYRIYALIMPQGAIITAADRIVTIAGKFHLIAAKLDTRIAAAGTAGNDVVAVKAMLDEYNAKVADASLQAQAAVNAIVALVPDNGDADKMKANTKALQGARAQIVVAQKDLQTARKDADKILLALKGMKVAATTTTDTTAGATTGQ